MMSSDNLFREGTGIYGRDGIVAREEASRPSIAIRVIYAGKAHRVIYSRFKDDRIAEVKLDGECCTEARLASLLLQRGIEIEEVRRSCDGLLGAVLDHLMELSGGPRSAAYRWLSKMQKRRTLNRRWSTQMWKHQAEADEGGEYISVASFHDAAIELGFTLEPIWGTDNCWINLAIPRHRRRR